jgi:elongation factor 1-beta
MTDASALELTLATQQWVGGLSPASTDKVAYDSLKTQTLSAATHPHVFAWFSLVNKFSDSIRASWGDAAPAGGADKKGGKQAKGGKKGAAAKEAPKADDDDLDLFGDDNEEDAAAAKEASAKIKADAKKVKKVVKAMSLVMLEVKPIEDTTNLDDLFARILKEC